MEDDRASDAPPPSSPDELLKENAYLRSRVAFLQKQRTQLAIHSEMMGMLAVLSREVNSLDIKTICRIAIEKPLHIVSATKAVLALYDAETGELRIAGHNLPSKPASEILPDWSGTLVARAMETGEPLLVQDIDEMVERLGVTRSDITAQTQTSCIIAPLVYADTTMGVLVLSDKTSESVFDEVNDMPALIQISRMFAAALHNCELFLEIRRQSRSDGLTGLANHNAFYEVLAREVHRSHRYDHELTLVMIDLDDFKAINDTFGHQAGDEVLLAVARAIAENIRSEDTAARYGGDEFGIILPETCLAGGRVVAERIDEIIDQARFDFGGTLREISCSIGMANLGERMMPADLVREADLALYRAKAGGKGRIVLSETVTEGG